MRVHIKRGGSWHAASGIFRRISGIWTEINESQFNLYITTNVSKYGGALIVDTLDVGCTESITAESFTCTAIYNKHTVETGVVWSITSGQQYAQIAQDGTVTIDSSANNNLITVSVQYGGLSASKNILVTYLEGSSATTETETIENPDGSTSTTTTTITVNEDGSSTTSSTTVNYDENGETTGSSESTSETEINQDGSTSTNCTTVNYDVNGDVTGSQTSTITENIDGSSSSSTTNYDANGDPTSGENQEIDTSGNASTQDITYDENGDPEVTGYTIDTSGNIDGEKTFDEDGVNTEFYGFDATRGFVMRLHFSIDLMNQPADQDENHHNILTMKRATPEPWYGFQIRHTGTNRYVMLGTQFAVGTNTNTQIPVGNTIATNVVEYDLEVTYDPTANTNKFVCRELINDVTVFSSNNVFPDIPELRYLTVCIGYALDSHEDPFRYSNINVYDFSISKLELVVHEPIITCTGQQIVLSSNAENATIYYKLDHAAQYSVYTSPIAIYDDTFIEAYAAIGNVTSNVVSETCIYVPSHDYSQDYLTFRALTAGTVTWKAFGSGYTRTIEYSLNNGSWTRITSDTTGVDISVDIGDEIRFRGTNSTYAGSKSNYSGFEGGTADVNIEGNIMSLIYGDNFIGNSTLSGTYNFCSLFKNLLVVSAENLILPALSLTSYCYRALFSLCTKLVSAPALPATTLAQGCYWYMFEKCKITTSPDLLAATLVRECYGYMFTGCTLLNTVKCLATAGLGTSQCLNGWMNNVSGTGTFTKATGVTWASGSNGIPSSWQVVEV